MLLEFYRARPPGVHAWHGESDPHDWRLDGIDDEDIDIDDDERDATAAAPAEVAGLAKAPARDEAAEEVKIPELVAAGAGAAGGGRDCCGALAAGACGLAGRLMADLLVEELMAEVRRRPTY